MAQGTPSKINRNFEVYALRNADDKIWTYSKLAKRFKISRARAKQLYDNYIKNKTKKA